MHTLWEIIRTLSAAVIFLGGFWWLAELNNTSEEARLITAMGTMMLVASILQQAYSKK